MFNYRIGRVGADNPWRVRVSLSLNFYFEVFDVITFKSKYQVHG